MWWFDKEKHLPKSTGPHHVGCTDIMIGCNPQRLFARLYYPTNQPSDEKKIKFKWIPDDSYIDGFSKVLLMFSFMFKILFWWTGTIYFPAIHGAKLKKLDKYDCIVFSHGLGGSRFFYTNIYCELASRGFLVMALEHRDQSATHTFYYRNEDDAQLDKRTPIIYQNIKLGTDHHEKRKNQVIKRAEECCESLDFLEQLNAGNVPKNVFDFQPDAGTEFKLDDLIGRIRTDNISIIGHSFGGATALLALSMRDEFKRGVLLDPWMFPIKNENLPEKIGQPLLFINTQTFHITQNVDAMAKYLTDNSNRKMYTILHTTHESQTDSALIAGYWLNWFMKKLSPELALKINNALTITFLVDHGCNVENDDDCREILKENAHDVVEGLTKPWDRAHL